MGYVVHIERFRFGNGVDVAMRSPRRCLSAIVLTVIWLAAMACSTDTPGPGSSADSSGSSGPVASSEPGRDEVLSAQVPEAIRARGTLLVATAVPYRPSVFVGPDGKLTGFDVEVMNAVGRVLGLTPEYVATEFADIIPAVAAGTQDVGMRAIFDTKDRENEVDMVTYFSGGTQWVQRAGDDVNPNNACGQTVGAEDGTVQAVSELPAKSQSCTVVGDPAITVTGFDTLDAALAALTAGEVQAVSADSPAASYAATQSHGALALAGLPFDTEPYAFPVGKGSPLAEPLRAAVQKLIDTGSMRAIAQRWGLESGLIDTSHINGATSS